jgi:hypothetical protein
MREPTLRLWCWLLCLVLGPIALVYQGAALYCLAVENRFSFPVDLRLRWIEERSVAQHLNPQEQGHPDPDWPADYLKPSTGGSYPPWAYATGLALVPPIDWPWTRGYFALLNLLALCLIGWWAYRQSGIHGRLAGTMAVCCALASFPFVIAVSYGQYPVLILACLVGALVLSEKGYDVLAGLCMGLALVKPQLSGLFFLVLFLQQRWRLVATALGYLAAASAVAWAATGADPVTLLRGMAEEARSYHFISHNPLLLLMKQAFGLSAATLLLAGAGVVVVGGLALVLRGRVSTRTLFSVAAVVTMFWSYRRHYDCVLLAFLAVGLVALVWQTRSKLALAALLLFVGSLIVPIRTTQWHLEAVQYGHLAIWVGSLVLLIWMELKLARLYRLLEPRPLETAEAPVSKRIFSHEPDSAARQRSVSRSLR